MRHLQSVSRTLAALAVAACLGGTAQAAGTPGKPVGDAVAPGDMVGLVEVMKTFVPITAELAGTLSAFHVDDEEPVMAGQPLYDVET